MWNRVLFFILLLLPACAKRPTGEAKEPLCVSVTIEPQRFFVEKIGGGRFKANVVVPAGQSPETYDPTPQQMISIQQSAAYLRIGHLGFEQVWMEAIRKNNPGLPVFDLSEGMVWENTGESHAGHSHAADPHIWNSFEGAKIIAYNVLKAFKALDPKHGAAYEANYIKLTDALRNTEATVIKMLQPFEGQSFIIYHPTLTYFAREFHLVQLSVEKEGKEPSPIQMQGLVDQAKRLRARIAFIQEEFDTKNVEAVAQETGCRTVTIRPLSYDCMGELLRVARIFAGENLD
ncbi:MAG: zinc ABC transporter substrate-binding protein [Tannerellaceae bacterium]|jgi:zinc transport system substrate-binding protein|nr:zinc ABC transporter substrate-binding protein [Tannerellaceae bacterium]